MLVSSRKTSYLRFVLYAIDSVAVVVFLWVLILIYRVDVIEFFYSYIYLSLYTPVFCFIIFCTFSIYRSWYRLNLYKELILISQVWGINVALLLFLFFSLKVSAHFSRLVILIWFAFTPFVIFLLHMLARYGLRFIRRSVAEPSKAVIIGVNETARSIVSTIEASPWSGIKVTGFFDDDERQDAMSPPLLGKIDELPDYLEKNSTDYVYIALPMKDEDKIHQILSRCRALGAELFLVPSLQFLRIYCSEVQLYGDLIFLSFTPHFHGKRLFDLVFALVALICFLPFGLLIALLIKLEDGGPVFYGHRRITLAGKPFTCWKFRTMTREADSKLVELLNNDKDARAEWKRTYKLRSDPRVTRVGGFLRRTSIDEFPQFINVLKGDMSVVGARPIVEDELRNYYRDNAGSYCSMRPGITGPWQAGGRSNSASYDDRVKQDVWYLMNHSIWVDLKIILKTIICVLTGRGAC
jgi:putative colanic acid biosysnthesis UDP-glucose lipid carrier transferase